MIEIVKSADYEQKLKKLDNDIAKTKNNTEPINALINERLKRKLKFLSKVSKKYSVATVD